MGILEGRTILVTGVLTDASIAYHVAATAQAEGARVVLSSFGRASRLTQRFAARLDGEVHVVELDVTNRDDLEQLPARLREVGVERLDGVLHSIGFAPQEALGGNFLTAEWEHVSTAVEVSAYSLKSLTLACRPLFGSTASVVGLDFDATQAWPAYDWMGVAKAALESTSRYLARDLGAHGIRVNLVAAGPLRTMAAKSIPGFADFEEVWSTRAPLGWNLEDPGPAAKACVALLSDWFPATTGEIVHVDGGFHAVGA